MLTEERAVELAGRCYVAVIELPGGSLIGVLPDGKVECHVYRRNGQSSERAAAGEAYEVYSDWSDKLSTLEILLDLKEEPGL